MGVVVVDIQRIDNILQQDGSKFRIDNFHTNIAWRGLREYVHIGVTKQGDCLITLTANATDATPITPKHLYKLHKLLEMESAKWF